MGITYCLRLRVPACRLSTYGAQEAKNRLRLSEAKNQPFS